MNLNQFQNTKKNLKVRIFAIVVVASLPALYPVTANATTVNVNCGSGGSFRIDDNVVISSERCTGGVNIPEGVTSIGESAFDAAPDNGTSTGAAISSIVIPSSVTSIGLWAFRDETSISRLVIPNSVTSVGDQAFSGLTSLANLTIGNGLSEIGSSVFAGASSLRTLSIPSNITIIGARAFSNTTSLTKVIIPSATWFIGDGAFSGATSLSNVYFLGAAPLLGDNPVPFRNIAAGATAYVTSANLSRFPLSSNQKWNGFSVSVGDPDASDFIVLADDGAVSAETAEATAATAARATAKAAEARREAEKKAARADIVAAIKDTRELTLETFAKADIPGINTSNIAEVQAELIALPESSRGDINQVLKVARKYEVVGIIASDQVKSVLPNTLVEIGLVPESSKNKVALAAAIKKLPPEARDSLTEIKAAIEAANVAIQKRADRLAKILASQAARSGK